jgi:hypothetical protein
LSFIFLVSVKAAFVTQDMLSFPTGKKSYRITVPVAGGTVLDLTGGRGYF